MEINYTQIETQKLWGKTDRVSERATYRQTDRQTERERETVERNKHRQTNK